MASRKFDSVVSSKVPKTFSPTSEAPGAMPSMRMLHAARIGLGAEVGDVVRDEALAGDGVRVEEGLVAAGGLPRAVTGEVLVVDEGRLAVLADEVDVVRVDAVRDVGDLHAGAGKAQRARGSRGRIVGVGVRGLQRFRVEQYLAVRAAGAGNDMRSQRRAVRRRAWQSFWWRDG